MTHDPLCKGGDCTCTCDQLQEGHRPGCPGEDCDCLFIAEIRADERSRWNTPYWSVDYHRGYRQAQQDEREHNA